MKKGYISCPYCANEIREGALKCQYCHEFLNKDTEENNDVKEQGMPGYKNKRIWIILGVIIIIIVISNTKRAKTQRLVDKVETISENARTYDDIKTDLNNIKKKSPREEAMFEELGNVIDEFYTKNQSVDENLLYLDTADYKNTNKIQQSINSRDVMAKSFEEYTDDFDALLNKYKDLDDTGNGKYSLTAISKEIKKMSNAASTFKNKYVSFYNYILTIQEDFYIESDGQVYFYDGGIKMDKYNQLSTEVYDASIKFLEDFTNYSDYLKEYNKYRGD